jgi:transmembrane sensor
MTTQEFDALTGKYLAGLCTPEETALLEKWANLQFDEHTAARQFDSAIAEDKKRKEIWKLLRLKGHDGRRRLVIRWLAGIAASLLLLGVFFGTFKRLGSIGDSAIGTQANAQTKVTLPDGSVVILEEGADIVTDKNFGLTDRRVWLKGEAFFQVTPNPLLPFFVQSEDLVTEVMGTSFRIKPQKNQKKIEVFVMSGKVSIYTAGSTGKNKKDGVIATPNQKISYDQASKTLRQDLVDSPMPVVKITSPASFKFDEEIVETVLARISETYGVQLISGNPNIRQCVFTGDLNGLDMYRQLDFLCEVIGAKYEVRGTAIFISGPGCQNPF